MVKFFDNDSSVRSGVIGLAMMFSLARMNLLFCVGILKDRVGGEAGVSDSISTASMVSVCRVRFGVGVSSGRGVCHVQG